MSDLLLCTREGIGQIQTALAEQDLDGWLLYEFRGANPIAKSMLGVGKTTRRGFFLIPRQGDPVALIHAIEGSSWRHWPWEKRMYSGWREMEASLEDLLKGLGRVAMEVSPGAAVPTLDYVPAGLAEVLLRSDIEATSSGNLISRFHSVWTPEQLEDHQEAAEILPQVAMKAFEMAAAAIRAGSPTNEGALTAWIKQELTDRGLSELPDSWPSGPGRRTPTTRRRATGRPSTGVTCSSSTSGPASPGPSPPTRPGWASWPPRWTREPRRCGRPCVTPGTPR